MASDLSYPIDWTTQTWNIRFPTGFNPAAPAGTYGLLVHIHWDDSGGIPASLGTVLDGRGIIAIGGTGIGNTQATDKRISTAIAGAMRFQQIMPGLVDPQRVYGSGQSGGGRVSSTMVMERPDYFHGHLGFSGASFAGTIPGWTVAGNDNTAADGDYELASELLNGASTYKYRIFTPSTRFAIISQTRDFRRAELTGIYRFGHLAQGNTVRLVARDGGHTQDDQVAFDAAMRFLDRPMVPVFLDRFQDRDPTAGSDVGDGVRDVSATGASVSEGLVPGKSASCGALVLHTDGTGMAAAAVHPAFAWNNAEGVVVDAHVRPWDPAGQNQRIGIHVVPADRTGSPATAPGFHLTLSYGSASHQAVLIDAAGTATVLGSWSFAGSVPWDLAAGDKLFWYDAAQKDVGGSTVRAWAAGQSVFRGDDLRLVVSNMGFQATFSRPCSNLSTTFGAANGVFLFPTDAVQTPYTESAPYVLQGWWPQIAPSVIAGLTQRAWRVVVTNQGIAPGLPVGDACVDELGVMAGSVLQPPSPPTGLTLSSSSDPRPTLSGSATAGNLVRLSVDGSEVAQAVTAGSGRFSIAVPVAMASGPHVLGAVQEDTVGSSAAATVAMVVNRPPVLVLPAEVVLDRPGTATLAAQVTDDGYPQPARVSLAWTVQSGSGATIESPASATTAVTCAVAGTVVLRLVADDGAATAVGTVALRINAPPELQVPATTLVRPGTAAVITATARDDGLPTPALVWSWQQIAGPAAATIAAATSPSITFSSAVEGTYRLRCTVGDGALVTEGEVAVVVAANTPPSVTAVTGTSAVPAGGVFTLTAAAGDDRGAAGLTYAWALRTGPAGAPALRFDSTAGPSASSATIRVGAAGHYEIGVTVSDGEGRAVEQVVSIDVPLEIASMRVDPVEVRVFPGATMAFTCAIRDQFGHDPGLPVRWGVADGGMINATGLFLAGRAVGGPFIVTATAAGRSATAAVRVVPDPALNAAPVIVVPSGPVLARVGRPLDLVAQVTDPDPLPGYPLSARWLLIAGPESPVVPADPRAGGTFTFRQSGTYHLRLEATDGIGTSAADMTVTVYGEDEAPVSAGSGGGGCGSGSATGCALALLALHRRSRKTRA